MRNMIQRRRHRDAGGARSRAKPLTAPRRHVCRSGGRSCETIFIPNLKTRLYRPAEGRDPAGVLDVEVHIGPSKGCGDWALAVNTMTGLLQTGALAPDDVVDQLVGELAVDMPASHAGRKIRHGHPHRGPLPRHRLFAHRHAVKSTTPCELGSTPNRRILPQAVRGSYLAYDRKTGGRVPIPSANVLFIEPTCGKD